MREANMANRGYATHGKQTRRVRLWLRPETWALIDQAAAERYWDARPAVIVERILEDWAKSKAPARLAQSSSSTIGPVSSSQLAQSS